jgi:hypothetical protein
MEMHLTRVILRESRVKEVLKMRKKSKNNSKGKVTGKVTVKANSKSRMRRLSTKMEMHPVGVILEDGKVKGVLKQRKQSKNKGWVAANKAKSQQTTVRATEAMTRPAHLTSPRRDILTCGRRIPSSRV